MPAGSRTSWCQRGRLRSQTKSLWLMRDEYMGKKIASTWRGRTGETTFAAAVGDGAAAAMSAFRYIQEQGNGTGITSP